MSLAASTALLIGSGLIGAGLFIPASRKLMLGSVKQDWLANELEFDRIGDDRCTVHLKSGTVFRVWALEGTAYETKLEHLQEELCTIRSNLFLKLANKETTLRFFGIKRKRDISFKAEWPSITLEELDRAEQKRIENSYEIRWFIVQEASSLTGLEKLQREIRPVLSEYKGRLLETPDEETSPCELTGFLNYLICGEYRNDLNRKTISLSGSLPAADLNFFEDGSLQTRTPRHQFHRMIAIREWPESISGELIGEILSIPCDIELFQVAKPMKRANTIAYLQLKKNQNGLPFFGNDDAEAAFQFAMEEITADKMALSETQFQITLRADSEEAINGHMDVLTDALTKKHVSWSIESTKAIAALWFNRMPGFNTLVRPLYLSNHNIAALWPFMFSPRGMEKSYICDKPVRLLKTPSGGSYSVQFQSSDKPQSPGNFLVFAPTGSGKSTLIILLLTGLAKNPAFRSYIFDSNEGTKFMIEVFGGLYQSFEDLQFNPLDVPDSSQSTRQAVLQMIRTMLGESYTSEMDDEILFVIESALSIGIEQDRRFDTLHKSGFEKGTAFEKAFQKWLTTEEGRVGEYAHIFNAARDSLKDIIGTSFMTGINMNQILMDEVLGPAAVLHITNAIASSAREHNSPHAIFIDEAANLLRNDRFREDFATVMYREIRKMNGFIGMAFQEPGALSAFPKEAQAIIQNTSTFIFFPSSEYTLESLAPFKMNQEQLDFVRNENPVAGQRRILILKRDAANGTEESAIIDIDLSDLGDALRFFRSGIDANNDLEELKTQGGENWLTVV